MELRRVTCKPTRVFSRSHLGYTAVIRHRPMTVLAIEAQKSPSILSMAQNTGGAA